MFTYAETQLENKAICLSLGERSEHRSDAGSAKKDDECTGMKPSLHFNADDDLKFPVFFPPSPRRRENAKVARTDWWWFAFPWTRMFALVPADRNSYQTRSVRLWWTGENDLYLMEIQFNATLLATFGGCDIKYLVQQELSFIISKLRIRISLKGNSFWINEAC